MCVIYFIMQFDVLERVFPSIKGLFTDDGDLARYKRNLLKVEIFYEAFNYESIQEEPDYMVILTMVFHNLRYLHNY